MRQVMLTTIDNPFDPFTQNEEWGAFDTSMGYHTTAYLSRIVITSEEISPQEHEDSIEDAINEIMFFDITGNYKKVYSEEIKDNIVYSEEIKDNIVK